MDRADSMTTTIVAISDTHCASWDEVHPDIRRAVAEADIAVHCGDFTRADVVDGVRRDARRAIVVHGNSDPAEIRRSLPYVEGGEAEGKRSGVTHPAGGGPECDPGERLPDFPEPVDIIVFGHLHETVNEHREGVLFVNPGQAYASFMVPSTIAVLTVTDGEVSAEIRVVEPAR